MALTGSLLKQDAFVKGNKENETCTWNKEIKHSEVNKVTYKDDKYSSVLENVLLYGVSIILPLLYCETNSAVLVHHFFKKHILDICILYFLLLGFYPSAYYTLIKVREVKGESDTIWAG